MSTKFVVHCGVLIEIDRPNGLTNEEWETYREAATLNKFRDIMYKQGVLE